MTSEEATIKVLQTRIRELEDENSILRVEKAELKEALHHYRNFPPPHPLCAPGTVHIGDPKPEEGLGSA